VEKTPPPQSVRTAQATLNPTAPTPGAEPGGARGPWIAMLIWFAAFLGLTLTIWFDYFYGLFRR
jgi:hypothetical protein